MLNLLKFLAGFTAFTFALSIACATYLWVALEHLDVLPVLAGVGAFAAAMLALYCIWLLVRERRKNAGLEAELDVLTISAPQVDVIDVK